MGISTIQRIGIAIALVLAAGNPALAQQAHTQSAQLLHSFNQLNQTFLSLYHTQDPLIEARIPLIIVVRSESMTAIEPDRTTTYQLASEITEIKSALHATLGFQGIMTMAANQPSDSVWAQVGHLREALAAVEPLLAKSTVPQATRDAVQRTIRQMQDLVEQALNRQTVTHLQVAGVLSDIRPTIKRLIGQMGHTSIAQMTNVFRSIQEKVPQAVWDQAIVVVPGPATARIDNLAVASAIQVFGLEQLGRRIFYSEGIFSDDAIRSYVKLLMRDKQLSNMLFEDPYRMWRDLFADVSRQYVPEDYFTPLAQDP